MKIALRRNQVVLPILVTVCVTIYTLPLADAAGRGGGHVERGGHGGGRDGGGARGGGFGGGGARPNDSHADARTRNVRNTSVNNVNVNRNVNVNANNNQHGGNDYHHGGDDYHHGGWDDDYHPIATAAAVTATVAVTSAVIGSIARSVPPNCVPVNYGGMIYQQCGSTWYQPQGAQYIVVNAPY